MKRDSIASRFLSIALSVALVVSLNPAAAFATGTGQTLGADTPVATEQAGTTESSAGGAETNSSNDGTLENNEQTEEVKTDTSATVNETQTQAEGAESEDVWYDSSATEYVVETKEDLLAFAAAVNAGDTFAGKVVKLGADIDLAGIEWSPIGGENIYFAGEFNGQGYAIKNLTQTTGARMGLFGLVEKAYIHDFTMENVNFTIASDNARVGAIAGNLQYWNVLKNITINGITITANGNDGLIGSVAGYVWKSQMGNVDVKNAVFTVNGTGNVIGGNTGYGRAHVWDTGVTSNNANWLEGTVQAIDGTEYVLQNYWEGCDVGTITIALNGTGTEAGGFFGSDTYNSHSNYFVDCHVTGLNVTAAEGTSQLVGGFIAWNNGTTSAGTVKGFTGCSVAGTINGANGNYGGFAGQVGGRACDYNNATADVEITCTGTAGGFVGITQAYSTHKYEFNNCTAIGDVTGTVAGGFTGKNALGGDGKSVYVDYNDCSAFGTVVGTSIAGGIIGEVNTELPATNWNIVDSIGYLNLTGNTASTSVSGDSCIGALIGYLDGVANGDMVEGNKLVVTLEGNTPENGINLSDDTSKDDVIVNQPPVAVIDETEYDSLAEAVAAAEAGATIKVIANHEITAPVVIEKNLTIDLDGKTITGAKNADGEQVYPVIRVQNGASAIVKDSSEGKTGGITNDDYVFVLGASDSSSAGNLTIESGTYTGNVTVASVTKGTLTITGGEFAVSVSDYGSTYLLNCIDANYNDGSAEIVVKGGTYAGFNPADNAAESGGNTDFTAPGYLVAENSGSYTVSEWDGTIDNTAELIYFNETARALADADEEPFAGKTVTLNADIDMAWAEWYPINFYGTFDGGNHTIKNLTYIPRSDGRMGFFQLAAGPVKNLTLDGIKGTVPANGRFGGFARYLNAAVENVHVKDIEVKTSDTLAWVGGFTTYTAGGRTTDCTVENLVVDAMAGADLIAGFASLTSNRQLYKNSDVIGFKVTVSDTDSSGCGVGGWAGQTQTGWNNPKFEDCDVTGIDVTATNLVDVGGFIAWPGAHTEYATNCTTEGKIDVTGVTSADCFAGGFFGNLGWNCDLGYMGHVVTNCTSNVDIITKVAPAGGFVGSATNSYNRSMYATFNNCSASGDITCIEDGTADIGGFAGDGDRGVYNNCFASGAVTNNGTGYAGQFIGALYDVTPSYDGRYPAGTRDYLVGEIAIAGCAYTGASTGLKFIGNTAEGVDLTVVDYVASIADDEGNVVKYETLAKAVAAANAIVDSEGNVAPATINLLKDVTLGEKLSITGNVTISGEYTITRDDAYTGTLLAVNSGATLTLDGGLTIDGANEYAFDNTAYKADLANWEIAIASADNAKWFTPEEGAPVATAYMITTSGAVNLNDVTVKNHYSTNGSGIVSASKGANVALTGAQITHNASTSGSGLVVNASAGVWSRELELITVTMNEGTVIDGNHVGGNHGVFKIYMGTYFTMNGGEIKNTTGWNSNGTAVGIYHAVFTMNGGTICSNSSVYGPNNGRNAAIYGHSNHLFTMNGGTICHNTGRSKAGIDSPYSETGYSGLTVINNGTVVDNTVIGTWTAPDVSGGATLTINGGTFTQDVTPWLAPDSGILYDEAAGTYGLTKDLYEYNGTAYNTLAEAIAAIKDGGVATASTETPVVTVLRSHKVDDAVVVDTDLTIDLNGKTITGAEKDGVQVYPIIRVQNGASAIVKDSSEGKTGGITNDDYVFVLGASDSSSAGNLTIESGTFHGNTTVASVTKGTLTVNGGEYSVDPYKEVTGTDAEGKDVTTDNYNFLLNCIDANYKDGSAKIEVKGGTFYKFDPANNAAEGASTSFVADGYKSVAAGDYYTVSIDKDKLPAIATITFTDSNNGETVTLKCPSERFDTLQELIGTNDYADFVLGAVQNELLAYVADGRASNIVLTLHSDVELDAPLNFYNKYYMVDVEYALTIDGNGHTITWADGYAGALLNVEPGVSVTTKNLTIDGENAWTFYEDTTVVENGQSWYTRFVNVGEEDKAINANVITNAGNLTLGEGTKIQNVTIASTGENGKTENTETGGYYLKYNDDLALIRSTGGTVEMTSATITGNAGMVLNADSTIIKLTNSTINSNMGAGRNGGLFDLVGGTMDITNSSINGNKSMARCATVIGITTGATVTMNGNSTINNNKHLGVGSNTAGSMVVVRNGSSFTMNGGSISNNAGGRAGAIASRWADADALITLNAGTISGNTTANSDWSGASVFLRSAAVINDDMTIEGGIVVNASPAKLDITGGSFTGSLTVADGLTATITGGTFNYDPTKWVAKGFYAVDNGDGTWTVSDDYAAWVKAEMFAGRNVTLEKDIVVDSSYITTEPCTANGNGQYQNWGIFTVIEGDVTLDLNGHTVTYVGHDDDFCNKLCFALFYANNGADLTITDSSEGKTGEVNVKGMATAAYSTCVGSELTIEGGTWSGEACSECGAFNIFLYASHGGTLLVKDGYFTQNGLTDSTIGSVLIVEHTGYVSNNDALVDYSKTNVEVMGGTFVGANPEIATSCNQTTWNNQEWGTTNVVAAGYKSVAKGSGVWAVEAIDAVAVNVETNVGYDTVAAAMSAAKSGETVKMLKSSEEVMVMVPAGITLDLNGNLLTATSGFAAFGEVIDTASAVGGVKADSIYVNPLNSYLPLYDTTVKCYKFFKYELVSAAARSAEVDGEAAVKFGFKILFVGSNKADAYKLMAQDGTKVSMTIQLSWTGAKSPLLYTIKESSIKTFAESTYNNGDVKETMAIVLTVSGLSKLEAGSQVAATPTLISSVGINKTGSTLEYNVQ